MAAVFKEGMGPREVTVITKGQMNGPCGMWIVYVAIVASDPLTGLGKFYRTKQPQVNLLSSTLKI